MLLLAILTFSLNYSSSLCKPQYIESVSNALESVNTPTKVIAADLHLIGNKLKILQNEKIEIKLYYEAFCPDCREFITESLVPTVEKLSQYLNINLYPYGNARTIENNGQYTFECQHGPGECYGNMLGACAIDQLANITKAVIFTGCMMADNQTGYGSDDSAADVCGKAMNIDSGPIEQCAKGDKAVQLLKHYGDESKKVGFDYVPYILLNGEVNDGRHFMTDVCALFVNAPPPCK